MGKFFSLDMNVFVLFFICLFHFLKFQVFTESQVPRFVYQKPPHESFTRPFYVDIWWTLSVIQSPGYT